MAAKSTGAGKARHARAKTIEVGGHLTIEQALAGARAPHRLKLAAAARDRVRRAAKVVRDAVQTGQSVYGVTTGFGSNADQHIPREDAERLQHNLLVSHAFGEGEPLPDDVVRLALLLRIHAIARGYSGMRESTLRAMIRLYEADVLAVIPRRGSVGASGDLAPLAYLALPLIGEGRARVGGKEASSATHLKRLGLEPTRLTYKEGLALINGMQISLAIGLLALERADLLVRTADLTAAMSAEALAGRSAAFDARLHEARGHPGQIETARRMRMLLKGSKLIDVDPAQIPGKRQSPQDAYGIRCVPQVHGAVRDGIQHARDVFAREVDAATDNPLVLDDDIVSGGNFHGEPLALAADHLKLCVHELGSMAERRVASLVDPHMNEGLPPYLAKTGGLHSGFMIPQYVAAALVSESKSLCFPASADSIPTGANIEDHVSMAPIAARRAREVGDRVTSVLAIECLTAAQAIDLRELAPGRRTAAAIGVLRTRVRHRGKDAPWKDTLDRARALLLDGAIQDAAGA